MEKSFKSRGRKAADRGLIFAMAPMFLMVVAGCLQTRSQIEESSQKRQVQDQVITLQRSAADQSNRFAEIDNDIRSLYGRVEALENRQGVMQQEMQSGAKSADLERRLTLLQEEMVRLNSQITDLTQELNAVKAAKTASVVEPAKSPLETADDLFAKKEWRKSILAYQKFRDQNPKNKRFAKATLRIGQAFQELGMKDDAKTFFDEVIAKFPQSEEAKQARNLLKKK